MITSNLFILLGGSMKRCIVFLWVVIVFQVGLLAESLGHLTLKEAIQKVQKSNIEINIAKFNEEIKGLEHSVAVGQNYGSLDIKHIATRSNDAGNIFGYKLQSREATFGDFGFSQFNQANPNVLHVTPDDLNYPKDRNLFQTQLEYTIPLYTGGKLEQYSNITKALQQLSSLEKDALIHQKIYEVKKSFYTIALLDTYIYNLKRIRDNVKKLESMTHEMIKEGYAKSVDLLEVEVKASDIARLIQQSEVNRELLYHFLSFLLNEPVVSISGVEEDALHVSKEVDAILEHNLDIQKAQKGLEISQMNIALQQSAFLPTVGAFAQYGSSDDKPFNDFAKHEAYTVGMQVKWNLFNGGIDRNNVEKARV